MHNTLLDIAMLLAKGLDDVIDCLSSRLPVIQFTETILALISVLPSPTLYRGREVGYGEQGGSQVF